MEQEWEELHGRRVIKGWSAIVARAQTYRATVRIRWDGDVSCGDCACAPGQLHVPTCCAERCPGCGGQLFGCPCPAAREINGGWPPEGH
jgi:hypothetical protein